MGNNFKRGRLVLIFLLFILCITGAAIPLARLPDVQTQLAAKSPGIAITITKPADATQWFLNSSIKIHANALSVRPIQSLELWVDGALVASPAPQKGNFGSWTWMIQNPGQHTIIVRAKDSSGAISNSNVVRVIGLTSSLPGMQFVYSTKNGDNIQSIAQKFGVPPSQINNANPNVNGNSPIPPGTNVKVPITFKQPAFSPELPPNPPPPGPSQPPSPNQPNKFIFWGSQFLDQNPPAPADLTLSVKACSINLLITDHSNNELGFNLYRLDPNAQAFKKIATLGANGDSTIPIQYSDPNLYGKFSYYVSSFNGQGESPSGIASAEVKAADCLTPFWSGSQPDSPLPTIPEPPLPKPSNFDKAYYYLSINGSVKQRVPADPNQFLILPNGIFNVGDQLKAVASGQAPGPLTVDMDAWGWSGGGLIHIGDFKKTIIVQQNAPSINTPGLLQVCSNPPCLNTPGLGGDFVDKTIAYQYTNWAFRWEANSADVTAGLAQVSMFPFDTTCNANPDGLVSSQTVPATGTGFSNFNIDFGPLQNKSVISNGWTYSNATQFYIRILPQANGQTVCEPSNSVTWSYQTYVYTGPTAAPTLPPAPQPPNPYSITSITFKPIQYPDSFYAHCVVVVANPFYGQPESLLTTLGYDKIWSQAQVGSTVCPATHSGGYTPPDQSVWDQVTSWVGDAINTVADTYNAIVNFAVQLADLTNPFCIQAKAIASAAGSGQNTVDQACHTLAEATVHAALAYAGLPPSLPNAKQSLVDLAAQQMKDNTGVPCDDTPPIGGGPSCKSLIASGVDQAIAQLPQNKNDSACVDQVTAEDDGYEPLCNPPGVQTVPDSRGQLLPSYAQIQITRDPNVPDSAFPDPSQFKTSCYWHLNVQGDNSSLIGQKIFMGYNEDPKNNQMIFWTGTSISGQLFKTVGGPIPALTPGGSIAIPITLDPKTDKYPSQSGYWLPTHYDIVANEDSKSQSFIHSSDDWSYLYAGALATVNASTSCGSSATGYKGASSPTNSATTQIQIPSGK